MSTFLLDYTYAKKGYKELTCILIINICRKNLSIFPTLLESRAQAYAVVDEEAVVAYVIDGKDSVIREVGIALRRRPVAVAKAVRARVVR